MNDWKQRTEILLGEERVKQLQESHVLVVGLGGEIGRASCRERVYGLV